MVPPATISSDPFGNGKLWFARMHHTGDRLLVLHMEITVTCSKEWNFVFWYIFKWRELQAKRVLADGR